MENKHETQEEVWWHKYVPKEQRTLPVELEGTEQGAALVEAKSAPPETAALPAPESLPTAPEPIRPGAAAELGLSTPRTAPLKAPGLGESILLAPQPLESALPQRADLAAVPGPERVDHQEKLEKFEEPEKVSVALEPVPGGLLSAPTVSEEQPIEWNPVWNFDASAKAEEAGPLPLPEPTVAEVQLLRPDLAVVELPPLLNEDLASGDALPAVSAAPQGLGTLLFGSKEITQAPLEELPLKDADSAAGEASRLPSWWPVLTWPGLRAFARKRRRSLIAAAAALVLFLAIVPLLFGRNDALVGHVEETTHSIAAGEGGIIQEILIKPWEPVKIGDELAKLRQDDVDAEIETLETQLRSRYEQRFVQLNQKISELSKFLTKSDIDHAAMLQESGALAQLVRELEQAAAPGSESAATSRTAERRSELVESIAKNHAKLTALDGQITLARQEIEELMSEVEQLKDGDPIDLATLDEQLQHRNLLKKRERLTLKSPVEGTVVRIHCSAGENVARGATLAEVVTAPRTIELDLPAKLARRCRPNDEVWVEEPGGGYLPSRILSVAPHFSSTEKNPGRKAYALFPLQSNHRAGQRVLVHFTDPRLPGLKRFAMAVARNFD